MENTELVYAGVGRRFLSYVLDFLFLLPLAFINVWISTYTRYYELFSIGPGMLIGLWYHVHLVKRYGGTPGKLLVGTKICRVDGSAVTYKEAFLRHSVMLFLSILITVAATIPLLQMSDTEYFSMNFLDRGKVLLERAPVWYRYVNIALQVWVWSEFLVMLTNKRRRALHDFLAGTVVVRSQEIKAG